MRYILLPNYALLIQFNSNYKIDISLQNVRLNQLENVGCINAIFSIIMKPCEFRGEYDLTSECECFRVKQMFHLFEHISKTHQECTFFSSKGSRSNRISSTNFHYYYVMFFRKVLPKAFGTVGSDLLHP